MSLQIFKPAKYSDADWLTKWHLETLVGYFGAIRTGSSVLGGETPDSDIDVFHVHDDNIDTWLSLQGFKCDGDAVELYAGAEFYSYRHPQSWVNCILLAPYYYPAFRYAAEKVRNSASGELALGRSNRVYAFKHAMAEWIEMHSDIYRKRSYGERS